MEVGVTLGGYPLVPGPTSPMEAVAEQARRAEELGYASVWVMDHFWAEGPAGRFGSHEPIVTLAYVAARTRSIKLGTLVLSNTFRHPAQLAREVAALADAARGRLILGVGGGWMQAEHQAFGFKYDYRTSRLEETLLALRPLLAGERVDLAGRHLKLTGAEVLTNAPAPEIWLGGAGPRHLEMAVRHADGWNVGWYGPDTTRFVEQLGRLRAAGTPRSGFTASVALLALPIDDGERAAALELAARHGGAFWRAAEPDERAIIGGPERLAVALRAYERAGAGHAILNLSAFPHAVMDESYLERAARALPLV